LSRTRIKFCGLTRAADVDAAVDLGVDAVGFVLVPGSPRYVDLEAAAALRSRLPPFVVAVALFRDPDASTVKAALDRLRPDVLQFHGDEDGAFAASFGCRYLAVVGMGSPDADIEATLQRHPQAVGVLLDAHQRGTMGGQGRSFDWLRIPRNLSKPMILAGGLRTDNVAEAVARVRPYAVDVSSGIEISPGVKDSAKMKAFIKEVQRGERG
jgi:phosphoribosylanthranilate isomerase